jgi:hypothetical protein
MHLSFADIIIAIAPRCEGGQLDCRAATSKKESHEQRHKETFWAVPSIGDSGKLAKIRDKGMTLREMAAATATQCNPKEPELIFPVVVTPTLWTGKIPPESSSA